MATRLDLLFYRVNRWLALTGARWPTEAAASEVTDASATAGRQFIGYPNDFFACGGPLKWRPAALEACTTSVRAQWKTQARRWRWPTARRRGVCTGGLRPTHPRVDGRGVLVPERPVGMPWAGAHRSGRCSENVWPLQGARVVAVAADARHRLLGSGEDVERAALRDPLSTGGRHGHGCAASTAANVIRRGGVGCVAPPPSPSGMRGRSAGVWSVGVVAAVRPQTVSKQRPRGGMPAACTRKPSLPVPPLGRTVRARVQHDPH